MEWYFIRGRPRNILSKATIPATLPMVDGSPSVQMLRSSLKSNYRFSRHDFFLKYVWPSGFSMEWFKVNKLFKDIKIIIDSSYESA